MDRPAESVKGNDVEYINRLTAEDFGKLELRDILDVPAFKDMMDDFYTLTGVPVGIVDNYGNILVAKGWQDICVKFHRVCPESCKNCLESDLQVTRDIKTGEYKQYRCKNNLWDVATPIDIGEKRMGYIYLGQFFMDDDEVDYEYFRQQAKRFGFDEVDYLAALDKVPRFSPQTVKIAMALYSKLAVIISNVSFNKIKLQHSLQQYKNNLQFQQTLMDAVPSPIFYKDLKGNYLGGNAAFIRYTGLDAKGIVGKTAHDISPLELAEIYHEADMKLIEEGGIQRYESYVKYAGDDTLREAIFDKAAFKGFDGEIAGLIGVITDISDRKRAEEALRKEEKKLSALFGAMTEMVALHDMVFDEAGKPVDYRITDCNKAFTEITGIKKADAVGQLATKVFGTSEAPYLEIYQEVAKTGVAQEYTTYYPPMDKYFYISAVSPAENQFATITTDITGMKRVQEELEAKNKELENYLYISSHDLRSPLVNVQGFSQRLIKQVELLKESIGKYGGEFSPDEAAVALLDTGIPRTLGFIQSNIAKMDALINGILRVSRTGRNPLEVKKIDMNVLVAQVLGELNHQLTEVSAAVEVGELPGCYGDMQLINQVFSNIIGNAIRHREPTRSLRIDITAVNEYGRIVYCVKDNGKGIADTNLDKIWNVFYQEFPNSDNSGDGLGLSIVKRIVNKHGGRAWVRSEAGRGSTFFIELRSVSFSENGGGAGDE